MTASQAQEPGPGAAPARKTFGSLNPATGQPIATFPVCQANLKEGIQLANASRYGLGSAVFARSRRRARAAARELHSGMTAINSVIAFTMVLALPFGGVGESGFGRIHGADGLREFTRAKASQNHQSVDKAAHEPDLVRPD